MQSRPNQLCRYCGNDPCEWEQFGEDIVASLLRMLTSEQRRRGARNPDAVSLQLYHYLKYGFLAKHHTQQLPVCIRQHLGLVNMQTRGRPVATPLAAAITSSSADRTVSERDVNASR
ncbi:uncharacterized protein IUM83_07429 [Phytophthora cinnamomi]|uniref:uncharacterized protein n=2 Tax=Phytophthora cinnamomi TaxID=4785 RepID=UPI00355A5566|nr:hypothetical protein IUM83_07429 [Phytophthora cinnamomi]